MVVPVLPATSTPEIAAEVPVPDCTTPVSIWWTTAAIEAGSTRSYSGVSTKFFCGQTFGQ